MYLEKLKRLIIWDGRSIASSVCLRIDIWTWRNKFTLLQVQVPTSGSETIECGVCQHPFLVSARWGSWHAGVSSRVHERKSVLFDRACCLSQTIHHVFMESFAAFCIWIYEILCKFSTVMLWSKQGWIRVPLCCSYLRNLCSVNWYAIWWDFLATRHWLNVIWYRVTCGLPFTIHSLFLAFLSVICQSEVEFTSNLK